MAAVYGEFLQTEYAVISFLRPPRGFNILRIYALYGNNWRIALAAALIGYGIPFTGVVGRISFRTFPPH